MVSGLGRLLLVVMLWLLWLPLSGCSDEGDGASVCGNGKVGFGEECDCGTDPDHLPPGCVAPNGATDSTCSADCRRITLEQGSLCGNGRDDDEDGATDCEDTGCASYFACQPEDCANEVDDDGNGLTDCEDPACADERVCRPEDCTNEVDDDGDGHADCQDEECLEDPACAGVEVCWNGVDDNEDGATDCADEQCSHLPECASDENIVNGNCQDGLDNDGDGWKDCADPGCANAAPCDETTCQADETLLFEEIGTFQTVVLDLDTDPPAGDLNEPCGAASSREKVLVIQTETTGRLVVAYEQVEQHKFGFYFPAGAEAGCTDALHECFFPTGSERERGLLDLGMRRPGTYILVVAEAAQGTGGRVSLTVSLLGSQNEEICGNSVDDDGDGTVDCGDLDCYGQATCQGSACIPDVDLGTLRPGDWVASQVVDLSRQEAENSLSCLSYGGPDMVFGFAIQDALPTAHLKVYYDQSMPGGGDSVLGLFFPGGQGSACDAAEHACRDTLGYGAGYVDFGSLPDGNFYLVAKAPAGRAGKLRILLVYEETDREICDNGVDDNDDGATDCEDAQCATAENCVVEQCVPGSGDEDGDGVADCQDVDPDDMCQCSYVCSPDTTCDGGQSGQQEHDPEIVFLGTCDVSGLGALWSGTVDASNWYGPGQPARDDYEECPELATQFGSPEVVLYFRVTGGTATVRFDYDNGEPGVYHLAELLSAEQCYACDSGPELACVRMTPQSAVSGSWTFQGLTPGDYVFLVAEDLAYRAQDPNGHSGPLSYQITCSSGGP